MPCLVTSIFMTNPIVKERLPIREHSAFGLTNLSAMLQISYARLQPAPWDTPPVGSSHKGRRCHSRGPAAMAADGRARREVGGLGIGQQGARGILLGCRF
jgi:hypothetical protein